MSLTVPKYSRGPVLDLDLPASTPALDVVVRNVTTGQSLRINLPASWPGASLKLDFFRQTIIDDTGADRSALLNAVDHALWNSAPLIAGANDLDIEVVGGPIVIADDFNQTSGDLHGKSLGVGSGTWVTSGLSGDITVEAANHTVTRYQDTGPRIAIAGSTVVAAHTAKLDFRSGFSDPLVLRLLTHYVDSSNFLFVGYDEQVSPTLTIAKAIGGSETVLDSHSSGGVPNDSWHTIEVTTDAAGNVEAQISPLGGGAPYWSVGATDSAVATGGTIDDGKVGFVDGGVALWNRYYDSLRVYNLTPTSYNATAELHWEVGHF